MGHLGTNSSRSTTTTCIILLVLPVILDRTPFLYVIRFISEENGNDGADKTRVIHNALEIHE